MGKIKDEVVDKFMRKNLKKMIDLYRSERIILFGSRAKGTNLLTSDIDLIVVPLSSKEKFSQKN